MLDVAATVIRTRQPERLEADQRDGFGLDFPETARRQLGIGQTCIGLGRVPEHDMGEFMEPGFVREFREG